MATTTTALRRQIGSADDLKSVVRTMKASAASAIGQYKKSVAALADYARAVPGSVLMITRLVGEMLLQVEMPDAEREDEALMLFYNRPNAASGYAPVSQRLLPLDERWQRTLARQPWPTARLPDVLGADYPALQAFIREPLFVSLSRASAESLASENASRLSAMQRADRNIGELLEAFNARFHRLRQGSIDEELFDVIAGFDALVAPAQR